LFIGLAIGIVAGPRLVGALSRRRWFGLSIVLAAVSVTWLALAWHLPSPWLPHSASESVPAWRFCPA
jgi:MFS family permease